MSKLKIVSGKGLIMPEFTEPKKHISFNQNGEPILSQTQSSVIQIGIAYEKGVTKEWLMEQYGITAEELEVALAYFQENREAIRDTEDKTKRIVPDSRHREAFEALRKKKLSDKKDS
jgi:uncharacterized protein (DUF433 family)